MRDRARTRKSVVVAARDGDRQRRGILLLAVLLPLLAALVLLAGRAVAQETGTPAGAAAGQSDTLNVPIVYLKEERETLRPVSILEASPDDEGIAGASMAIDDNNTTGRFLKQSFSLDTVTASDPATLVKALEDNIAKGIGFFVVDASADTLLKLSDAAEGKDAVLFNAGAPDERLREEQCRKNIKHTAASRTMLTDALAQYLAWKRWSNLVMVKGPQPQDEAYAAALRRSMKRFGLKIIEEHTFEYKPGSQRADGGYEQIQQQIPTFTQKFADYDVLLIADEARQFGEYFAYRTWTPRPVAGTHGLRPITWHPASELWGATQFRNRFRRKTNREMLPLDYAAWMAVRAVGESATRERSGDPKTLIAYMLSPKFELAAFKGQRLTFRPWNGQLRQPIFVGTPMLHVTVSPQPGFLHQVSVLDTLGVDKPETKCTAFD